jgi:hypothetical protein
LERLESRNLWSGDTLGTATGLSLLPFGMGLVAHTSGFLASPNQVELYKLPQLQAGAQVSVGIDTQTVASGLESVLRVFDNTGKQVALDDQEGGDPSLTFQAAQTGDYFVGVSSTGDDAYNPTVTGSGKNGTSTGLFSLNLRSVLATPAADLAGESFRLNTQTLAYGDTVSGSFTIQNRGWGATTSSMELQTSRTCFRRSRRPYQPPCSQDSRSAPTSH